MEVGKTRMDGYFALMQLLVALPTWHPIGAKTADTSVLSLLLQHDYATKPGPSRPYMTLTATFGRRPKVFIGNPP